jgi:hypothetical protein
MEYTFLIQLLSVDILDFAGFALAVRLSGYQPQYFPRLHYFARILDSDIFTISDYLQYVRKHASVLSDGTRARVFSYQAHVPIKTREGSLLLDIPVRKGGVQGRQSLNEAQIDYSSSWQQKHLNNIHSHYLRAPRYEAVFPSLSLVISQRYSSLAEYTIETFLWGLGILMDIPCVRPKGPTLAEINDNLSRFPFRLKKIIRMSQSGIPPADKITVDANDWLIDTCRSYGADEYVYGGTAARAYMDFQKFECAGIVPVEQNWHCPQYSQLHGAFIPNLSIIDLLMNIPPAEAREILHVKGSRSQ